MNLQMNTRCSFSSPSSAPGYKASTYPDHPPRPLLRMINKLCIIKIIVVDCTQYSRLHNRNNSLLTVHSLVDSTTTGAV